MSWLTRHWQRKTVVSHLLWPVSVLYCLLMVLRRALYAAGWLVRSKLPVPVIIVGNLTVGGTGKTPLVIWLVNWLTSLGYRPGVVSRGYGGRADAWPQWVKGDADPVQVGDEPVLIARHVDAPVMVDPRRPRAARRLVAEHGCDIIVSDDGLQHYALARDIELAVVDGQRRYGNGRCLPAGPLREPLSRLATVDMQIINGAVRPGEAGMRLVPLGLASLVGDTQATVQDLASGPVHAVAGIGHPSRFFDTLRGLGLEVIVHGFPDHHHYRPEDVLFHDDLPVIMTEKDAVKCRQFAHSLAGSVGGYWVLAVTAELDSVVTEQLSYLLEETIRGQKTA